MSYEVQLRPRLEDIKSYTVPKQCSSCFRKPAPKQRVLTAQLMMDRRNKVQWLIQLPLCQACYDMYDIVHNYRPSLHGPPERRQANRWATLAILFLFLAGVVNVLLVPLLVPAHTDLNKFIVLVVLGLILVGVYYWNTLASQRAQSALFQDLVEKAGHGFSDAHIRVEPPPRGPLSPIKKYKPKGPTLIFDNEEFGQAFEKANPDLLAGSPSPVGP